VHRIDLIPARQLFQGIGKGARPDAECCADLGVGLALAQQVKDVGASWRRNGAW